MRKMLCRLILSSVLLTPSLGAAQSSGDTPGTSDPSQAGVTFNFSVTDGLVPFRCPIDRIRNAYQNLVNPDDALMALAIEKQTLAICRQSQEALIRIAENEMRLRDLFEQIMAPPPPPTPEPPIALIFAPEPSRNVMETLPLPVSEPIIAQAEETPEVEAQPDAGPTPMTEFTLGVLMRDPEGRKAILLRGEQMFTVREGEQIDERNRVIRIDETSLTIADSDGNEFQLE
jgi:hypothetical protein